MKNTFQLTSLFAVLLSSSIYSVSNAQTELPVSHINAVLAVPVPASAVTHVGLPFTEIPVGPAMEITAKGANTLTVAGTIPALAGPHSAQIIGGAANGTVLTVASVTATEITTVEAVPSAVKADLDFVKIIPNWTLGTFLAGGGSLTAGADATLADKVAIENLGVVTEYYFNSTNSQWQTVTDVGGSMNATPIPLVGGIRVTRIAGSATEFVLHGVVRTGTQRAKVKAEATTILGMPFAVNVTLSTSGLSDLVVPGATAALADVVSFNGVSYFRSPAGWRLASGAAGAQDAVVIPAGSAVEIERKAASGLAFSRRWRGSRPLASLKPKPGAKTDEWVVQEPFAAQ